MKLSRNNQIIFLALALVLLALGMGLILPRGSPDRNRVRGTGGFLLGTWRLGFVFWLRPCTMQSGTSRTENDSMKGKRRMIFTWSKLAVVAGIFLFTVSGFPIARQIGVEQWQMAGLVAALLLWAAAYRDLESRLTKLESKVAEVDPNHH
jgi:hypothetical protein